MKEEKHPGTASGNDKFSSRDSGRSHGPSGKGSTETKLCQVHENKIVTESSSMGTSKDDVRVSY